MTNKTRNFWIVIDHPLQLLTAISISRCLEKRKVGKPILIVSKHEYWRTVKIEKYSKYFSDIFWFRRVGIPPFTMPIWKQFIASGMLFFELALMKFRVFSLKIKQNDVILGLSGPQILENVILSVFKGSRKVVVIGEADMPGERLGNKWKRENVSYYSMGGWIFKFIYSHFFKLLSMDVIFKKDTVQFTDSDWLQIYTKGFKNVYDKILVLNNITSHLKESGVENIKNTYFPYFFNNNKKEVKRKVVYFGMPYINGWGVTEKQFTERINKYLAFVSKYYGNSYDLEYRQHPQERTENIKIDLKDFKLARDRNISELYLFEKSPSIKAAFSVCSNSCRSALNFGINSYVYPNLFPLKPTLIKTYKELYGNVPDGFYLKSLKAKPTQIKFSSNANFNPIKIFENDLFWAMI